MKLGYGLDALAHCESCWGEARRKGYIQDSKKKWLGADTENLMALCDSEARFYRDDIWPKEIAKLALLVLKLLVKLAKLELKVKGLEGRLGGVKENQ